MEHIPALKLIKSKKPKKISLDAGKKGTPMFVDLYDYLNFEGFVTGISLKTEYDKNEIDTQLPNFGSPKTN